MTCIYTIQNT